MEQKDLQKVGESVAKGKGKGKRPNKSKEMSVQATPEENSRYVAHVLESFRLPPIDLNDPKQVQDRIEWYFKHCVEDGMKPTVAGICNALKIDRQTFYRWGAEKSRSGNSEYSHMVKNAKATIMELWEQYASDGKVNPVTFIFLMKNHHNYSDRQEIEITPSAPLGDQKDMKELEAQYRDSVPIDVEGAEIAEGAESENLGQSDP